MNEWWDNWTFSKCIKDTNILQFWFAVLILTLWKPCRLGKDALFWGKQECFSSGLTVKLLHEAQQYCCGRSSWSTTNFFMKHYNIVVELLHEALQYWCGWFTQTLDHSEFQHLILLWIDWVQEKCRICFIQYWSGHFTWAPDQPEFLHLKTCPPFQIALHGLSTSSA